MTNLRKVKSGDPLRIPAAAYNAFVDAAKRIVKKPIAARVEKVYEEGSFAGLGIGV